MPPDRARVEEVRAWLARMRNDLRGADIDLAAAPPLVESLKAFLVWHDRSFGKTHSLEEIGHACEEIDGSLKALIDAVAPLSEYAWAFRYPGPLPAPTLEEAKVARGLAGRAADEILKRLPEEARG